jgi:spermidine synthase
MATEKPIRAGVELVVASFVVLALELTLIRWIPGQLRVIAYFPNLVLISAFLGLGIGCLLARVPTIAFSWLVAASTAIVAALSGIAFTQETTSEFLWLLYFDLPRNAPVVHGIRLPIIGVFVLGAAMFVPLGAYVAERLRIFRDAGRPLTGYACDLAGSLLGVIVMSALFFARTRPVVWFAVVLGAAMVLFLRSRVLAVVHVIAAIVIIVLVYRTDHAEVYSPYYAITARRYPGHVMIMTNGAMHQDAMIVRRSTLMRHPGANRTREGYHVPYRLLDRKPRHVLVLGAGTGNDVSVALDEGAESVDAVEIDPEILKLGAEHPDKPYSSPRVRQFNTDARAFLNYNHDQYDLIIFGTLDSMTRLSALSNVRLDNFVYTVECLKAAKARLTSDGGIVMYFRVGADYLDEHIAAMLVRALGERPNAITEDYRLFNRIFLAGPAFAKLVDPTAPPSSAARDAAALSDAPTDDWPYLYLRGRGISAFYLSIMAALLAISAIAVLAASREMRSSLAMGAVDVEMFLFGIAFLLMETKLVTEMNLVWGATWITSAVVFGSILLMVLAGTLVMTRYRPAWRAAAAGLIATLFLAWAVPVQSIVGRPLPIRLIASMLYAGLPVFFSSICFAILFRERERPDVAFAWNMLGAVVGGLLEFGSMAVGIKAMTLLALVAYLLAILRRQQSAASPGIASAGTPREEPCI